MQRNLTTKTIVIVATILLCIFGIIGLPKSKAELMANLKHNIQLGLDLKGGSHLVLPGAGAGRRQDRGRPGDRAHQGRSHQGAASTSPASTGTIRNAVEDTDTIQINIHGVERDRRPARSARLIADHFPNWILTPVNATDYKMNMKPSALLALKRKTVDRAIETISNRVNALGLTEPTVQQHGRSDTEFEILVELPGVDDPAHVKEMIGTAAQLEIVEVKEGPFPTQEAALWRRGGILPLNTKLREGVVARRHGRRAGIWSRATP